MGYRSLKQCVDDLDQHGYLVRIEDEVDANLEAAEIQRRVYASGGPAVYFANIKGCKFPMVSNLFGSLEQARFIFRDTLERVKRAVELKADPSSLLKRPGRYWKTPLTALAMRPKVRSRGPVLSNATTVDQLPGVKSWPDDGGPFITLPQVYSENIDRPGVMRSNLGMYRIQLSGNQYAPNEECGMHYQIHRGIGVHHQAALKQGKPLNVNVFVGGTPAMTLASVMPLPEGLSELTFAGALAGHRISMVKGHSPIPFYGAADFVMTGEVVDGHQLPEGPFGDHLGYYSLSHDFPVLRVKKVFHRDDAIWPFTVVGRPPQEDTTFGELIHEITGPMIPTLIPGLKHVHAVDAAGVHPLMLAIGSERYTPYSSQSRPQELLTQANAVLGNGQMSLAKYLVIANEFDDADLDINDIPAFFHHVLQRVDWSRDLHFQTKTTMDTLDYTAAGINQGSKLIVAASGPACRELPRELTSELTSELALPERFSEPRVVAPGILAIQGPSCQSNAQYHQEIETFCLHFDESSFLNRFPMIVIVDDSDFCSRSFGNFLWVTFTRSDPAVDTHGIASFVEYKHSGCRGSIVIDARIKPHHAPPLIENSEVSGRVDALAAKGGPIAKYL